MKHSLIFSFTVLKNIFLIIIIILIFTFWPGGTWDLSFPARNQIHTPCSRSKEP